MFDLKMFITFAAAMIAVKLLNDFFLDKASSTIKTNLELK
jgi:hypothetical protein